MERLYFRDKAVLTGRTQAAEPEWNLARRNRKKKIAVVGISRGAGATFVAMSLAFLLSKNVEKTGDGDRVSAGFEPEKREWRTPPSGLDPDRRSASVTDGGSFFSESRSMARMVRERSWLTAYGKSRESSQPEWVPAAYVEMRQPDAGEAGAFFGAGLDLRFRGNRFTDFFALSMQGEPLQPRVNLHKGINWVVWRTPAPGSESSASLSGPASAGPEPAALPLDQLAGEWIVTDSPPLDTLHQYDLVIGVINPLPSHIFAGSETYEFLRDSSASGLPLLWVVNCDNAEVNHSELKRFLRLPAHRSLPLIDPALFYRAQYACRLPAELLAAGGSPVKHSGAGRPPQVAPQQYDLAFAALKELEKEVRNRLEE